MTKLEILEDKFDFVSKQIEKLEIKKDEFINQDKCTFSIEDKIYDLEDKQYLIQLKIEKLNNKG